MKTVKVLEVVKGLLFVVAGIACLLAAGLALKEELYVLYALFALAELVVLWVGGQTLMNGLFGEEGLVCDFPRSLDRDGIQYQRSRPVATRVRVTRPSAALRRRGAKPRCRGRLVVR